MKSFPVKNVLVKSLLVKTFASGTILKKSPPPYCHLISKKLWLIVSLRILCDWSRPKYGLCTAYIRLI